HHNSWVRGLAAETIIWHILNSSESSRKKLLNSFRREIRYWLSHEDDCWVLEHLYRLFSAHPSEYVHFSKQGLLPLRESRLLRGVPRWYTLERGEFLRRLEARKEAMMRA